MEKILGTSWYHCVTTWLLLQFVNMDYLYYHTTEDEGNSKELQQPKQLVKVQKSNITNLSKVNFLIANMGLCEMPSWFYGSEGEEEGKIFTQIWLTLPNRRFHWFAVNHPRFSLPSVLLQKKIKIFGISSTMSLVGSMRRPLHSPNPNLISIPHIFHFHGTLCHSNDPEQTKLKKKRN